MEHSGGKLSALRTLESSRLPSPGLVLLSWAAATLVFAALLEGSFGRGAIMVIVYWSAAIFALASVGGVAMRVKEKLRPFWALLWMVLLTRLVGHLSWSFSGQTGFARLDLLVQDVSYFASYVLLLAALVYLVGLTTRGVALVSPLDAMIVMLSAGLLVWYFVLGPAMHAEGPREVVENLSGIAADAGFLFLCLLVFSSEGRPLFAGSLAGSLAAFVTGDLLRAAADSFGPYEPGRWPEMLWALGVAMMGLAASRQTSGVSHPPAEIHLWKTFVFWLGPLSPAVQYAFLLCWATLHPPVPPYVTWAGVALVVYFALRTLVLRHVGRSLRLEGEGLARKEEQGRISRELHDTVKQNVVGTSMILKACEDAHESGDSAAVGDLLEQALETCGEAGHQLSKPFDELAVFSGSEASTPTTCFANRAIKFGEYFGLEIHVDLRAPLEELCPAEVSVARRVANEAFWNAAKHSCAENLWLESHRDEAGFAVRVHDDGRGFCPGPETEGMGLGFMRSRAAEIGAEVAIDSGPGEGTTVEIRFSRKG